MLCVTSDVCVIAAAVCDFCKRKESELYQKEVCRNNESFTIIFIH